MKRKFVIVKTHGTGEMKFYTIEDSLQHGYIFQTRMDESEMFESKYQAENTIEEKDLKMVFILPIYV